MSISDGAASADENFDLKRGVRLSAAMRARGIHYNCQLCYDVGVKESTLSRWRSGAPMSIANAISIADYLGVSLDWLLMGRIAALETSRTSDRSFADLVDAIATLPTFDQRLVLSLSRALVGQQRGQAIVAG